MYLFIIDNRNSTLAEDISDLMESVFGEDENSGSSCDEEEECIEEHPQCEVERLSDEESSGSEFGRCTPPIDSDRCISPITPQ